MQTLNQSMEKMQEALESQKEFFREILETKTDVELKEIQSEIKSVKGLLLNRYGIELKYFLYFKNYEFIY